MARTYLQLVNDVLVRLRETPVSTVTQTPYSALVGALVNDAKREVEDAWQWSQLLDYLTFSCISGISSYETNTMLTRYAAPPLSAPAGGNDRARLWVDPFDENPSLYNVTPNFENRLRFEATLFDWTTKTQIANNPVINIPSKWQLAQSTFYNDAGKWNKAILLWDPPNAAYTMQLFIVNPQQDLAADSDVLKIPYALVVQKARLFALYERGEELGPTISQVGQQVEDAIADAISHDMADQKLAHSLIIPYGGQY